ncbi:hypothetical protein SO802_023710 [Lithocarpus litseifolius]|uniref:CCHC-type domain-containing protein n=1 Tax=Lithocarpus litseifolius TaxID=425828 RepID=A0AAW2C9J9_9ROSI
MERVRERLKRTEEEEDTLACSTKKFKENHFAGEDYVDASATKQGSCKDKLVGAIPGAFKQAFGFGDTMHEDLESDTEEDNTHEGCTRILFSKEEKARQHFLAIRQWEPGFKASSAEFTSVAVWIRLPELPIEFYKPSALLKIGKAIGPVLRIDANTANGVRGTNALCFSCGRIGHKREACPYHIRETPKDVGTEQSLTPDKNGNDTPLDKGVEGKKEDYGDWMVVSRRKPSNKNTAKLIGLGVSYTAESSQAPSCNSGSRMLGHDKTEGKRKACHLMPSDKLRGADKTFTSNRRNAGPTKNVGDAEGKTQQRFGLVRDGFDDGLEKYFSTHGDKQEVGVAADEIRSLVDHSESLVEIPVRQTSGADPSSDQLGSVSNRIKGASFRKISGRGRNRMDTTGHLEEEDSSEQADRMLVVGESSQGEVIAVRRACDQRDHAHQSFTEHDGDNQSLGHFAQGEAGAEDGAPGSMESRLDRCWANPDWKVYFSEANITHLARINSDHCPLLLNLNPDAGPNSSRPFRFQSVWLSHKDFLAVVRNAWTGLENNLEGAISRFTIRAQKWNREIFGNVFTGKKKILNRLLGIQRGLANRPSTFLTNLQDQIAEEYNQILQLEEEIWAMKARTNWNKATGLLSILGVLIGLKWTVNNGRSINFWKDFWLPCGPLCNFIEGPLTCDEEHLTVQQGANPRFSGDACNVSFELPDQVLSLIKAVPFTLNQDAEDTLTWAFSKDGSFSLKSAYLLARGSNPLNLGSSSLSWIWKADTHPRVQFFLWLCSHNNLPTEEVLGSRGLNLNPLCTICHQGNESVDHLLRGCFVAQDLWRRMKLMFIILLWHGVKQPRNPWSDGPEYITQCPIQPGGRFRQKIIFSSEEGTLWWHAHSEWWRATVHGAIIIHPKKGTRYPFPLPHAEVPIIFGEWWKQDILAIYDETIFTGGAPNVSDAFTINGQPGVLYPCSKPGVWFLHCHFDRHMTWGMDMAFVVKNGKGRKEHIFPPPPDMPPC